MSEYRNTLERELGRLSPPKIPFDQLAQRRDRRRRNQRIRAGALGLAIATAIIAGAVSIGASRSERLPAGDPTPAPSEDLGIFAPVAGRIVYGDRDGIWGIDPASAPDRDARALLTSARGQPLEWSRDGTRLLMVKEIPGEGGPTNLVVLHADGSETLVTKRWVPGATISPDGSRVVFATFNALWSFDVAGGPPVVLLEDDVAGLIDVETGEPGNDDLYGPQFSPDGTRIAFVYGDGDHGHSIWVMKADGSDPHLIVDNDTTAGIGHPYDSLAWSPAGDRIAFSLGGAIYTFAPDGSGFERAVDGDNPNWSPDGSQLAYALRCGPGEYEQGDESGCNLAIAEADGSNVRSFGFASSGPWHPGQLGAPRIASPSPAEPVSGEPVLHLQSWARGFVELAVYADGRVIWVPVGRDDYLEMRVTREAVERLQETVVSTGLFDHDLAIGLDLEFGHIELRRANGSVIVGWGETPKGVSGLGIQGRFVEATPAQASDLIALEEFLQDPAAWGLPPDMYLQPDAAPFAPTHLWVSWDRGFPDPSALPSPAREVLTRNLEPVLAGRCEVITIAAAGAVAQAMEQAGLTDPDDLSDGISFTMPGKGGGVSFLHAHPALPHASTCG